MTAIFFAIKVDLIPGSTKKNVNSYKLGKFSNDKSLLLIGGYKDGIINADDEQIKEWLSFEPIETHLDIVSAILSSAIQYTKAQFFEEIKKPSSVWYQVEDNSENG